MECISKDQASRRALEECDPARERSRESKGKEEVPDESQKKRKRVHITSSPGRLAHGPTTDGDASQENPMAFSMKATKIEAVRRVEEKDAKREVLRLEAERAEKLEEVRK